MALSKAAQAERTAQARESREHLLGMLSPGDTVSTILRHVSRSGMLRRISLVVAQYDEPVDITWHAARVMGESVKNRAGYVQDVGLEVGGCGMDMGFHLVYRLSHLLWPQGFDCTTVQYGRTRCPANDHCNDRGISDFSPTRHHADGGYALNQRWL